MNIELSSINSTDLPGFIERLNSLTNSLQYKIAETEIARCVHFVHFTPLVEKQIRFAEQAQLALGERLSFISQLFEKGSLGASEIMKLVAQPVSINDLGEKVVFSSLIELAQRVETLITQPYFHNTIDWF